MNTTIGAGCGIYANSSNTGIYGRSSNYLDISGITNKDSSFLVDTSDPNKGKNSIIVKNYKEINVSDSDIMLKSGNNALNN